MSCKNLYDMLQPYGGQVLFSLTVFIGPWKLDQLAFLGKSVGYKMTKLLC